MFFQNFEGRSCPKYQESGRLILVTSFLNFSGSQSVKIEPRSYSTICFYNMPYNLEKIAKQLAMPLFPKLLFLFVIAFKSVLL